MILSMGFTLKKQTNLDEAITLNWMVIENPYYINSLL